MNVHSPQDRKVIIEELEDRIANSTGLARANALMELGHALRAKTDLSGALAAYGAARDIFTTMENAKPALAFCDYNIADVLLTQGNLIGAIEALGTTLESDYAYHELGPLMLLRAAANRMLGALEEASEDVASAQDWFEDTEDIDGRTACLFALAEIELERDGRLEALDLIREARRNWAKAGDTLRVSHCDFSEAEISMELGKLRKAKMSLNSARIIAEASGLTRELGHCDDLRSKISRAEGRREQAIKFLRKAINRFDACESPIDSGICHDDIGFILHELGEYEEAVRHHERAQAIFRDSLDEDKAAISALNLGQVLTHLERNDEAVEALERANERFQENLDLPRSINCVVSIAPALVAVGRTEEGKEELEWAQGALSEFDESELSLWAQMAEAQILAMQGDWEGCRLAVEDLIIMAPESKPTILIGEAYELMAKAHGQLYGLDNALTDLAFVIKWYEDAGLDTRAETCRKSRDDMIEEARKESGRSTTSAS